MVAHEYAKVLLGVSKHICYLGVDCINRAVVYYLPQVCENDCITVSYQYNGFTNIGDAAAAG
jgi:hypothetical protein